MKDYIETNKKYKYSWGGSATILTTTCPNKDGWCVISMDSDGQVYYHKADGTGIVSMDKDGELYYHKMNGKGILSD